MLDVKKKKLYIVRMDGIKEERRIRIHPAAAGAVR
jgi:hypothetical protein